MANHELSTIFNGDLAFYKTDEAGSVSQNKQFATANKRAGMADSPGTKLRIGIHGTNPTFRVAFFNDVELEKSKYAEQYVKVLGKSGEAYNRSSVTDAQGFCSLDRYLEILAGQGLASKEMIQSVEELKKDKPDFSKVTEVLNPVKGFLQGQRHSGTFGRVMPNNLKYSLIPIIPSAIKNNSTLQKLHKRMSEDPHNPIDEAVFTTASKFGTYNINNVSEDIPLKHVVMSNEDWRIPQVVPYKTKTTENFGSQMRKLITGNLDMSIPENVQLKKNYQEAMIKNLAEDFNNLRKEFSGEEGISIEKIAKKVLRDLSKNSYKATPDFMEQALTYVDELEDTFIPMSFPSIKHKVESSINSAVRKAVTKQSLPGFVAVQYASLGHNSEGISTDETLEFVHLDKNGDVVPAEARMSPQYFIQTLLKKKQTPEIDAIITKMRSGDFNVADIPNELREMVIYRIPTQGKNSALPIRLKSFTPEAFGATITLPAEITTQSGSDYDIDKVYVEIKHFTVENGVFEVIKGEGRKSRNNTIIDTHFKVLTDPKHFKELITPNNSDTLNDMSEEMDSIYNSENTFEKWSSVSTQEKLRERNQTGNIFIGNMFAFIRLSKCFFVF